MAPEIVDLGFMVVRGYGLMIAVGVLVAFWCVSREARRQGLPALDEALLVLVLGIAAAAFAGGKLAFAIAHPDALAASWRAGGLAAVLREGFVYYGALLLCVPVTIAMLVRRRLPVARSLDVLVLGVPISHGFGRLGCFLAGCCYGCRSDGPLAVTFTEGQGLNGVPLHPVQLYEAAGNFAVVALLLFVARRPDRFPGQVILVYLLAYAVLRFATELVRGDGNPVPGSRAPHVPGTAPDGLTHGQITSIVIAAVVLPLLGWGIARARSSARAAVRAGR